ncbi:MAG: flavodoxin domain-containing protein [Treponema sp.]|jgi:flavodoxin|nr:flavodoxin domain-containing protein [Treponema sp.]
MKIEIRYQSRGGNTKEVAETIAKTIGITAETIDKPLSGPVDILFIGGGVYKWGLDPSLTQFLNNLDPAAVKSAAAFTTASGTDRTGAIVSAVKAKGIAVEKETLPVKVGFRNHAWLGGKGCIKLKEKEIRLITAFADKIVNQN